MTDAKQAGLAGAFYGPPVPPPRHSSRGCGCRCCGCLLCTLFKFIIAIILILGIIVLVLWLVFRPNELKVYVEDAALARFDLSATNNSLKYNLSLDVSIRNPNRRVSIYYDSVEAIASYDGYRFGYDNNLPVFFQDHKNTTLIHPKFDGQQALAVASIADTYSREKADGWLYVEVMIYTRVRFKVWFIKINKYTPKFTCNLMLPAPSASGSGTFSQTRCDVDLF